MNFISMSVSAFFLLSWSVVICGYRCAGDRPWADLPREGGLRLQYGELHASGPKSCHSATHPPYRRCLPTGRPWAAAGASSAVTSPTYVTVTDEKGSIEGELTCSVGRALLPPSGNLFYVINNLYSRRLLESTSVKGDHSRAVKKKNEEETQIQAEHTQNSKFIESQI